MAWSDPKNKSFLTSGWKMLIAGLVLTIGGNQAFQHISALLNP